MFEIKVLFCALAGCMGPENGAPCHLCMCYSLYKPIEDLEKNMHTPDAQVSTC